MAYGITTISKAKIIVDTNRKELGAFYTPIHAVDYMISRLNGFGSNSRLLEPCGGDGVFVSRILEKELLKPHQITVWDINPEVGRNIELLGVNFQVKDSLLETDFYSEYFSHIIGNPPYLNKQSFYIKKNKNKLRKLYGEIGANDTYAMFLYLCGEHLMPNGQLSFIMSDTYLTLGIHKKLRKWLLNNFTIKEITMCPNSLFNEVGASVHTSIITVINRKPGENHFIQFNDCQNNKLGDYNGVIYEIKQDDLLEYPDFVFHYKNNKKLIEKIKSSKKIIDFLDGGLGMYTADNSRFLGIIDYGDKKILLNGKKIRNIVSVKEVNAGKWKIYHKMGGNTKYYSRPRYCINWDNKSVFNYKGLKNLNLNENKQGFIVSGVCSELSARLGAKNALWESNKAMCFFPKNPEKYPTEFFIGLLNSKTYNNILKIFNHTNSIQIRDIKKLPFFDFSNKDISEISNITKFIINKLKKKSNSDFREYQNQINLIVDKYVK